MMAREELIASAVEFLRDPGAAASPIESRIAFLRSKNLTQQEIDTALSRSGDSQSQSTYDSPPPPPQQQIRRPPFQEPYGAPYAQQPYWGQPAPPPLPNRDWRDYFIMATVTSGLGYGLLLLARRYILPLIRPPTPPQLAQDKASIDASFTRAFALLDQLTADTETLKQAEASRTERLDAALADVQAVAKDLKTSLQKRDEDMRRAQDEIRSLRQLVPKALDGQREQVDGRMADISAELKSLKTLIGNRLNPGTGGPATDSSTASATKTTTAAASLETKPASSSPVAKPAVNGSSATRTASPGISAFGRPVSGNGQASIPAWQRASLEKGKGVATGEGQEGAGTGGAVAAGA